MQINDRVENPAKQFLQRYIWLRKRRDALCEEIRNHYANATRCTVQLNPIRTGGTGAYDHMAEEISVMVDTRQRLEDWEYRLDQQMQQIEHAVEQLTDERHKTVIVLRYMSGYTWEKIAQEMHYDVRHIVRLHGAALRKITEYLNN